MSICFIEYVCCIIKSLDDPGDLLIIMSCNAKAITGNKREFLERSGRFHIKHVGKDGQWIAKIP